MNASELSYSYAAGLRRLSLSDGRPLLSETPERIKITLPVAGKPYDAREALRAVNNVLQASGRGERVAAFKTAKAAPSVWLITAGGKLRKLERDGKAFSVIVRK